MHYALLSSLLCFMCLPLQAAPPVPVTAVAAHPGTRTLAAASNGSLYLLHDQGDITDIVRYDQPKATAIAFRPDGKQLALACGAPGQRGVVLVYALPGLQLTQTLPLHRDLIHGLAYSPDGKQLATSSYDRTIVLMETGSYKQLQVFKEHSDAVYGLAWKPDGSRLASVSADRTVKIWEPATGKKVLTLSDATDWLYAVAWSADGKQLAAGGVDKSIRTWSMEKDAGTLMQSTFAHEKGIVQLVYSDGLLYSLGEEGAIKAWDAGKLVEKQVYQQPVLTAACLAMLPLQAEKPAKLIVGYFQGNLHLVDGKTGNVVAQPLPELFPLKKVTTPSLSRCHATVVNTPVTLAGTITQPGSTHYHRVVLKAGDELGMQVQPVAGSKLEPLLELYDDKGEELCSSTVQLGYRCQKPGDYSLAIRDRDYRGGDAFKYRLQLGPIPVITSHFPLEVQAGVESNIHVQGVHLQGIKQVKVKPDQRANSYSMPIPWPTSSNTMKLPNIRVTPLPVRHLKTSTQGELDKSSAGQGCIEHAGDEHDWQFTAQRGQWLVIELHAARLGSDLDSAIEIHDAQGKPVERAVLSTLARTYITLRDRDANDSGLRLENWSGFALNDYLYAGTELIKLRDIPKGPDEDCKFWTLAGKRTGFLGTTPRAQPLGGPIYKVQVHPPGTALPRTGFPTFQIFYRNDDGGNSFGKDSYLLFDPPADGTYHLRISDAEQRGGPRMAYAVTLRSPQPSYSIDFSPKQPKLFQNAAQALNVTVHRLDGFTGPIDLKLEGVDPSLKASLSRVQDDEESAIIALEPVSHAPPSMALKPFKLIASAMIEGKTVTREVMSQAPQIIAPGDIVTSVEGDSVQLKPGGTTQITARIERRNNFKGRVPLEVKGLPYGVQVIDVGLNGILIIEAETQRTFTLKAEPWVKPQQIPIVVVAKREGKGTEHGARTIQLQVTEPAKQPRNATP